MKVNRERARDRGSAIGVRMLSRCFCRSSGGGFGVLVL